MESESHVNARQKLFAATYALRDAPNIEIGLTLAAVYLVQLQENDLPPDMRGEFEGLRKALTTIPLSSANRYVPRPLSEAEASRCAQTINEMYGRLRQH